MKEPALQEWACRLLEDQLERLGELRNANPRDASFKLWRQTTLTVIQRVWPGDLQRSETFRRIPFTAPSAKPNRAQVKEHFERGCAEAAFHLRGLVAEIQDGALDPSKGSAPPDEARGSGRAERVSVAERLAAPLPGEVPTPPAAPAAERRSSAPAAAMPAPALPAPPPPPIRGFEPSGSSSSRPQAREPQGPAPTSPAPKPALGPAAPIAKTPRKPERRALKEMLGFVEAAPPASVSKPAPPEEPQTPARPGPSFDPFRRPEEGEPLGAPLPALTEDPDIGADADDLLRSSPSFQAPPQPGAAQPPAARPVAPQPPVPTVEPRAAQSNPVAAALGALASEVAGLGVPEGQRAAARAALTDLARQIEERTATWDTLRDAFHLVLGYPRLARRAIPLLVAFLDLE